MKNRLFEVWKRKILGTSDVVASNTNAISLSGSFSSYPPYPIYTALYGNHHAARDVAGLGEEVHYHSSGGCVAGVRITDDEVWFESRNMIMTSTSQQMVEFHAAREDCVVMLPGDPGPLTKRMRTIEVTTMGSPHREWIYIEED